MKRSGHSEVQQAKIASELVSGNWLRARHGLIEQLTAGLRRELVHMPKPKVNGFVNRVVTTIALSKVFEEAFSEERRIQDLNEMIAAANQFAGNCTRTGVLFDSIQPDYSLTPHASEDKLNALVSETDNLRCARKEALAAVKLYRLRLQAALKTARRRRRGEKHGADENGLFGKIACTYRDVFGVDPVSTPGEPFSNIVTHIRAYQTGKAPKDVKSVERIVRAALKTIRR